MQSFMPILYQPPTGGPFTRIAAVYDDSTNAQYPILSGTPPTASVFDAAGTDTTGEFVELDFTGNISALPVPAVSEFEILVDAAAATINEITVTAQNQLTFTLDVPIENGETVTIEYLGTTLLSLNGVAVAAFGPESVTNNVP